MARSRSGIALILTLSIVLVVGLLVLGGSVTGIIDRTISANQFRSNAAYYEALAGIDVVKTAVFRNLVDAWANEGSWCELPISGGIFDPTTGSLMLGRGLDRSAPGFRGAVGIGSYEAWYDIIGTYIVIESFGTVGNTEARVRFVADAGSGPGSAWDNAITAQGRPTEKAIAGNAAIYGSVHIVKGDFEDDDIDDIDGSIDLGGGAGVFSDYYGDGRGASGAALPGDIRELVREFVQGTEFGVDVDLCTRVKIARGNIYTQGNVAIGIEDPIERRQAVSLHLGEGYVCDKNREACRPADAVEDHNDSRKIHLRLPPVGMVSPYDPFEEITLPRLNEFAFTGEDVLRITYPDDPTAPCAWLYASTEAPHVIRLPPEVSGDDRLECIGSGSSIAWVPNEGSGYLEVTGRINIVDADVDIVSELRYRGTGSVLVGAYEELMSDEPRRSINVGAAVRPDVPQDYLEPDGSTLALLATGDVIFDVGASARPSAALVYAARDFVTEKQGLILGAVVAERFDFLQVPRIAYDPRIPEIADWMKLPGTAAANEEEAADDEGTGTPQSRGVLSNILLERF